MGMMMNGLGLGVVSVEVDASAEETFVFFYLTEQLAYGAGVFWGCVRQRSFSSYRPSVYRRLQLTYG